MYRDLSVRGRIREQCTSSNGEGEDLNIAINQGAVQSPSQGQNADLLVQLER